MTTDRFVEPSPTPLALLLLGRGADPDSEKGVECPGDLPAPSDPDLDLLSAREQEVMRLIARGYTYREVATRLHLSVKTVETHVSAVLRKLQLSNRHELTAWAADRRLL